LLEDEFTKPEATEIIRSIVERVEITANDDAKCTNVILHGDLAQMMAHAYNQGENGERTSRTFLMVAEEGLEPPTCGL
jgi:hypothetical protein